MVRKVIKMLLTFFICFESLSAQDKYPSWYAEDTVSVNYGNYMTIYVSNPDSLVVYGKATLYLSTDSLSNEKSFFCTCPFASLVHTYSCAISRRERRRKFFSDLTTISNNNVEKGSKMFDSNWYLFGSVSTGYFFLFIWVATWFSVCLYYIGRFITDSDREDKVLYVVNKVSPNSGVGEVGFSAFGSALTFIILWIFWPLVWFGLFGAVTLYALRFVVRASKGLKELSKVAHKHSDKGDVEEVEIGKVDWK